MAKTAAALIIGNEILTGKVQEQNIYVMGQELFSLGVELRRVVVCSDEIDVIAADLDALRHAHDVVLTSGGVGPTHDDVTMKAVARAFGVPMERAQPYADLLREVHGDRVTEAHLRMADVPRGARLAVGGGSRWPTVVMHNVYVLPGVPEIFRHKLALVRDELKGESGFVTRAAYTLHDEASIAPLLDRLAEAHGEVQIGSYLKWGDGFDYRTKVTVDGRETDAVERCFSELVAGIDPTMLVRTD